MSPGIGLMKRRLEKEKDAISLATAQFAKQYKFDISSIKFLEAKYDSDAGDWYVALGCNDTRVVVKMDSVLGIVTETKEI